LVAHAGDALTLTAPGAAESADAEIERISRKAFPAILRLRDYSYSKPIAYVQLGLGGRLPEFNLIPIQIIDPGKATV
jgi:hypothetical protein